MSHGKRLPIPDPEPCDHLPKLARHLCSACYNRWYRSVTPRRPRPLRPRSGYPVRSFNRYFELRQAGITDDHEAARRMEIKFESLVEMKRRWRKRGLLV